MTASEWEGECRQMLGGVGILHFAASEIAPVGRVAPDGRTRLRVPPMLVTRNAVHLLAPLLEWLRERAGAPVVVRSWYRDPAYNRAVGGAPGSLHLTGTAADVRVPGWDPPQIRNLLEEHPMAGEMGIGTYPTWTHVDVRGLIGRDAPARW